MLNLEQVNGGNVSLTAAGLAEGTNAATFKTTNTLAFTASGVFKSKVATDNLPFSAGHTALATGQKCFFGVWIDSAGNVTTTQGPIATVGDTHTPLPNVVPSKTLVGLIHISALAAFTPNTTDFSAANITATCFDCMCLPGTPPL